MADSGTLATTAQVLLAIGENGSSVQILEANTNIWILYAEADMSAECSVDLVTNVSDIGTKYVQWFAAVASMRAAWYAVHQNTNTWSLATAQTKLNVIDASWTAALKILRDKDKIALMGLTVED